MPLSPMMKQYKVLKEEYNDCIVFYRLGDFYEMFFEDAIETSKVLGLTLTGRDCGLAERAPMCGVPHHSANTYIKELVENNFKVAICEQMTPPGKGIVERSVVRVVTPGTRIDTDMLSSSMNNYIASFVIEKGAFSIAWADISTGELNTFTTSDKGDLTEAIEKLLQISPSEIISNKEISLLDIREISRKILPKPIAFSDYAFSYENALNKIKNQFEINSLEPFGIDKDRGAIIACGGLIEYLEQTQKRKMTNFTSISHSSKKDYLVLDSNTRRNLELLFSTRDNKRFGTLYHVLNKTKTAMGARLLTKWIETPLISEKKIRMRQNAVSELKTKFAFREDLIDVLKKIKDIERLTSKATYGNANPADVWNLKNSLVELKNLKFVLNKFEDGFIKEIENRIFDFTELHAYLDSAISPDATSQTKDGGFIKAGYSQELDDIVNIRDNGKQLIMELEDRERKSTGIKTLKIGFNRVFGYYIEVLKSQQDLVPISYVRKQTTANSERYITEELKELENDVLNAKDLSLKLEMTLFKEIIENIKSFTQILLSSSNAIAVCDVLTSFAIVADKNSYCLPHVSSENIKLEIMEGRHPVVETLSRDEQFVSNDTYISENERTMILTGPNMAGKSTYMRQVALIAIMAQMGSFVPAKSCVLPIFDRVFTRVGASDNLLLDQSTFMVEMTEVSTIINNATKNSLVILDEVGRGTSTLDGLSIAFSVTKFINNKIQCKTLFATHYHELTELEGTLSGVSNYRVCVREIDGKILFTRKIARGGANKSYGIEVASLAGLPKEVIKDAKQTLKELEKAEFINTKKQISFDDLKENVLEINEEENAVLEKLRDLDLDDLSPKQAYQILSNLYEEVKKWVKLTF